jgi:hypothetical protein
MQGQTMQQQAASAVAACAAQVVSQQQANAALACPPGATEGAQCASQQTSVAELQMQLAQAYTELAEYKGYLAEVGKVNLERHKLHVICCLLTSSA